MISVCVQNAHYYVYNIQDWEILRCNYRIIGELVGNNFCISSLPLRLLPEEAFLLLKKEIATFVKYTKYKLSPLNIDSESYIEFKDNLLKQEKGIYKEIYKNQVECIMERIVNGKRKSGDTRATEAIVKEHFNKLLDINNNTMLWPIFNHDADNEELYHICEDKILNEITVSKLNIFVNLWEKGYYITPANKFGGDYLLYRGDPILHHSLNIVHCVKDSDQTYNTSELVCIGRLGSSVKKRTVLATVKDDTDVSYITLNWIDI